MFLTLQTFNRSFLILRNHFSRGFVGGFHWFFWAQNNRQTPQLPKTRIAWPWASLRMGTSHSAHLGGFQLVMRLPRNGWFLLGKKDIKMDNLGVPSFMETSVSYYVDVIFHFPVSQLRSFWNWSAQFLRASWSQVPGAACQRSSDSSFQVGHPWGSDTLHRNHRNTWNYPIFVKLSYDLS